MKVTETKFPSKAAFETWKAANELPIATTVEIGVITQPATFDEEGNELTPATEIDGWHVDFMSEDVIPSLNPYIIAVGNPVHGKKWKAGHEIVIKDNN